MKVCNDDLQSHITVLLPDDVDTDRKNSDGNSTLSSWFSDDNDEDAESKVPAPTNRISLLGLEEISANFSDSDTHSIRGDDPQLDECLINSGVMNNTSIQMNGDTSELKITKTDDHPARVYVAIHNNQSCTDSLSGDDEPECDMENPPPALFQTSTSPTAFPQCVKTNSDLPDDNPRNSKIPDTIESATYPTTMVAETEQVPRYPGITESISPDVYDLSWQFYGGALYDDLEEDQNECCSTKFYSQWNLF